ncbi:MAG: hypothetical protein ACPIGF_06615 [Poseidonia sp.]
MTHEPESPSFQFGILPFLIMSLFCLQMWAPLVSAAGMQSCSATGGTCDEYDHAEDLTPHRQDWVEGTYVFDLVSTSSINLELTWAVREFERDSLGLGSGTIIGDALEDTDGLDANDGAPADLIRETFNQPTAGAGSPTVGQKLKSEVNDAVQSALESGFGTVTSISTDYVNSFTNAGITTACSTDEATDSFAEGASVDNVFEPPLCFTAVASVDLAAGNFNLNATSELDLERTYQGLLTMGAEINTSFQLTTQPGHKSDFVINPPSYSTVMGVDDNGSVVARVGPPSYWAAQWSMDHLDAQEVDTDLLQSVNLQMAHRNSSQTPTVWIEPDSKALDIKLVLDLRDDTAATIDFAAGLYYLDDATLSSWGIDMFSVSSAAYVPVITSDGIRLAYHNGIVDLTQFTNQFPLGDIVEGLGDTVAGVGDIEMSELEWVSQTEANGIFDQAGGLNYSHSTGCTEPVAAGVSLYYCLQGDVAMDASYPIYLQTTSQPFSMSIVDILKAYNTNQMVDDFLNGVQQNDLERVMNSGIALDTIIDSSYLDTIIPSNLPPSELTVEILVPSWISTLDGTSKIVLNKTIEGTQETEISLTGTNPYDWEHEIRDENDVVICHANQSTCVVSSINFDWEQFNLNEWSQSLSFTFALDVEFSVYRIGIPGGSIESGGTGVTMEAIPSDLIRLLIDISSRMDEPLSHDFGTIGDTDLKVTGTRQGMKDFTEDIGEVVTSVIHTAGDEAEMEFDEVQTMDLSSFIIQTSISGIEAPDQDVTDDEPLTFKVNIPEVSFTIGVDANVAELQEGNTDGLRINIVTDTLQSVFLEPMRMASNLFTQGLYNSLVGMNGVTYPPEGDELIRIPISLGAGEPETIGEVGGVELDTSMFSENLTGPISFTLPRGVQFVDVSSTSGELILSKDGGRQTLTYYVPAGDVEDEISFRIQVGWMYFLIQFWIYPTIVILLLVLVIRKWRKRRKRKKRALANRADNINKAQLGDHEFADLAGFSSPALRRGESIEEMAEIDDY